MIGIKSIEHGVAAVAHEISVGAKAVGKVIGLVEKYAPEVEAVSGLVDPRAATIERIGAALIGELQPQVEKATASGTTLAADAAAPSFTLSADAVTELKALYASLATEIAGVKATVAGAAAPAGSAGTTTGS